MRGRAIGVGHVEVLVPLVRRPPEATVRMAAAVLPFRAVDEVHDAEDFAAELAAPLRATDGTGSAPSRHNLTPINRRTVSLTLSRGSGGRGGIGHRRAHFTLGASAVGEGGAEKLEKLEYREPRRVTRRRPPEQSAV